MFFFCLQLFSNGHISGEKAARLKDKYQYLLEFLKTTRESESSLLYKAKSLIQEAQKQRSELEKGEAFPDIPDNEVKKLRTDWLKHTNELSAGDERLYQLEFKLESMREEKRILEREYSRMPKKEEIDKQANDLDTNIEELKIEIAQRSHESNNLREELALREQQLEVLSRGLEKKDVDQQALRVILFYLHGYCSLSYRVAKCLGL